MNDRPPTPGIAELVAAVVRPEITAMSAYVVAKAEGFIKLDAMENPYPPPADVRARLARALAEVAINRYPDGSADLTRQALARSLALPSSLELLLGNGSDELIQIITTAVARPGAVMLAPEPSFVMYRTDALFAGMRFVGVALKSDFGLDRDAMLAAIAREQPSLIFLAYPNNPTGNLFADADIEAIVRASPGLVVIDEAYHAFAQRSFLSRIADFPNVVILRTLSKTGMAGIRLGYAIGAPAWIAAFNKVRPPYNVNAWTQAAARALLVDAGWIDVQAREILAQRARLQDAMARLPGVTVYPTDFNAVLARVPDARKAFEALRERRILIKNLDGWHPVLVNCLRITVGTPDENDELLAALDQIVAR